MESLLNTWSIPLLQLFLESRNANIPEPSKQDQKALQDLVLKSSKMPIIPRSRTPSSIFDILTLPQLGYYLKKKRGHPVNANAAWLRFAPPKLGRVKRDALRNFALKEYETIIALNERELDQFDQDIADTLQQQITIVQATPKDGEDDESASVFGIYLLDDDIDVLYETWGIERDPRWSREEALMEAQKTGTFLVSGEVL